MKIDKSTPFWDSTRTDRERIDWLLSAMTMDEKLGYLSSLSPDLPRLGIPGAGVGGEAAHGVEGRNDQNGLGKPDVTTSFPQPIGMSASWDPEMIRKAGEVTGIEARVVAHRHGGMHGLSRWAPTVDLERDPRWGRNEEGYGEDPVLTGAMAGAYIRGMQGDDPKYLRIAATLKHFYANNVEVGRGWKNSTVDPRNKYELYLEPFRRCIEDAGAEAIMTAYNKINGTIGILNPEVQTILKDKYGLKHAVSDGGATGLVVTLHHYFGQHAETIATALKAGVDGMSDDPRLVEDAAREAYDLGLITEADVDRAIRSIMGTKLRLGIYDRENANPYDQVDESDIDTEENRAVCRQLSRESVVLLKNEGQALPLDPSMDPDDLALIGPLGDAWYQDWYGGTAPYHTTLKDGVKELLGRDISFADGLNRVTLACMGKPVGLSDDGTLCIANRPDVFILENWGEESYTFRSERTGKYLGLRLPMPGQEEKTAGQMGADRESAFDWFVLEIMHMEEGEEGVILTNRFHYPLVLQEDGTFFSFGTSEGTPFTIQTVDDGIERAVELAKEKKTVILALGCNSMINAKEEIDRNTLDLPPDQEKLLDRVTAVNPHTVLVLFTNYPYTMGDAAAKTPAILMSATGSQDMGSAMAEALFGAYAPAGRLNMTWYRDISQLPPMDDYDIIGRGRTYRYFDGEVLYPFGFGLTYTTFSYGDLKVSVRDKRALEVCFRVTNTGTRASDEVAQVYGVAPASRAKKPLRQLLGFQRLKDVQPGESRLVSMEIPTQELRFYDVVSGRLMVEEGTYQIFAGPSSAEASVSVEVFVPGEKTGVRDMTRRTAADHYDAYENICLTEGHFGYTAATLLDAEKPGTLLYRDCDLAGAGVLSLHVKSARGCRIDVYINERLAGSFEGDTRTCEQKSAPTLDRYAYREVEERNRLREPVYEDLDIALDGAAGQDRPVTIRLELSGDICLCYLKASAGIAGGRINLGVAN